MAFLLLASYIPTQFGTCLYLIWNMLNMLIFIYIHFCTPHKQINTVKVEGHDELLKGWRIEMWGCCLEMPPELKPHGGKGSEDERSPTLSYSPCLDSAFPPNRSNRRRDQWESWESERRGAYHSAVLWQRVPSAMLFLLRDGSVTVWLDWHSVKWGFLRALVRKDPSQQHFERSASAKLSSKLQ